MELTLLMVATVQKCTKYHRKEIVRTFKRIYWICNIQIFRANRIQCFALKNGGLGPVRGNYLTVQCESKRQTGAHRKPLQEKFALPVYLHPRCASGRIQECRTAVCTSVVHAPSTSSDNLSVERITPTAASNKATVYPSLLYDDSSKVAGRSTLSRP